MALFDRMIRVTVGQPNKEGVQLDSFFIASDGAQEEGFRISFDIDKDSTRETNKSKVSIYNLAPDTIAKMEAPDSVCIIEVGYKENIGLVRAFIGEVVSVTVKGNPDTEVVLELGDGQVSLRDAAVSLGYSAGASGADIIQSISNQMAMLLKVAPDVTFASFPNGFSFVGYARNALDKICAASGCAWSVQNGELQVTLNSGSTGQEARVFAPDSGLLESPERIIKSAKKANKESTSTTKRKRKTKSKKEKNPKKAGWKIQTLLEATVLPKDLIRVESAHVNGWFLVESLKHRADSVNKEFYTEFQLIEVILDG